MTLPTMIRVDPLHPELAALAPAAEALRQGRLVAFPTETVYGLGAHALDPHAVAGIFAAKGRPATNPLIVHVTTLDQARALTRSWPQAADQLAARFWPGPLTLVLPKHPDVPDAVTAGLPNVAIRIPAHPVARALIALADVPVCAPSANTYMGISPTSAAHVQRSLGARVGLIVDGGSTQVGLESTVLSLLDPHAPQLLRHGMITADQLEAALGIAVRSPESLVTSHDTPALAPGMAERHYAPSGELRLVEVIPEALEQGACVLRLGEDEGSRELVTGGLEITLPRDPTRYASLLYDALHRFDMRHAALIYAELPPQQPAAWLAIHDRLRRAASPPPASP